MPLYEYACPTCDDQFERLEPMSAEKHTDCPECGTTSQRVLSLVAAPISLGEIMGDSMPSMASGAACCGGACAC
jgi:putative FmdB family regulatory protein